MNMLEKRDDMIRSGSLAFRRRLPPMQEPPYNMAEVQRADRELVGSVATRLEGRPAWLPHLAEMLLLCNEASKRQHGSGRSLAGSKPLSLEYMADRLDTDDPLWGYTIRQKQPHHAANLNSNSKPSSSSQGGACSGSSGSGGALAAVSKQPMQGYVTCTTFTTWVRWFRWDSLAELAGLEDFPNEIPKGQRKVDKDGSLAKALEASVRDGDPDGEGVVWPHIAEVSLLGGLGTGRQLLDLVLDDLEAWDSPYNFVVLQATENAVPFYEAMGFTRVGAVARYQDLDPSVAEKRAAAERAESRRAESRKALEIIHALEQLPDLKRPLNPKAAAAAAKATAASSSSSSTAATPKASEKASSGSSKSHKKGAQSSSGKRGSGAQTTKVPLSPKRGAEGKADAKDEVAAGAAAAPLSPTSSLAATVASNGAESEFEKLCEAFLELPTKKELPEYYQVIKAPISLACMKERARRFEYSSVSGPPENVSGSSSGGGGKGSGSAAAVLSGDSTLERDLRLMCDNAKRFNAVGSTVWRAAEALERAAARRLVDPSAPAGSSSSSSSGGCLRPASELGLPPLPAELAAAVKPGAFWRQLVADLCLDCKDSQRGHWLKAKVVEVDDLGRALVHFQGWAKKWDEWYAVDSDDLAPAGTHTDQAPVALRVIDHLDEDALLAASAFRVKAGITLQVTCDANPSSKKLGVLPAGMVVAVSDRFLSSCGRRVERVFFEQTSRPSAPARGWVNLRKKESSGGASSGGSVDASALLMDPVEAQGLGAVSSPLGQHNKLGSKGKLGGSGFGSGSTAAEQAAAGNKQKRRRKPDAGAGSLNENDEGGGGGFVSSLGVGASAGCTECRWHVCKADDTPAGVATAVGCSAFDVVFLNKHLYAGLAPSSKLRGGTRLRVPRPPDVHPDGHDDSSSPQVAPPSMWHECKENETPRDIAKRLNLAGGHAALVALNSKRFPELAPGSRLRRGTRLRLPRAPKVLPVSLNPGELTSCGDGGAKGLLEHVPDLEELYQEALIAWEEDPDVVAYRHWTFPDDENVEDTHASYMMAKKIVRRPRTMPPPAMTRFEEAAARHASTTATVSTGGRRKRGLDEVDGATGTTAEQGALQAPQSEELVVVEALNKRGGSSGSGEAPVPKAVVEAMEKALTAVKTAAVPHDGNRLRCDLFLELPPRKYFPDYYVLIAQPICLKQIEKRLASNKAACSARPPKSYEEGCQPYGSLEDFTNEVQRVFDNARSYNLPKSEVYEDAEEMEVVFRDALATATATLSGDTGAHSSGDLFNKVVSVDAARDGSSLPYGLYFVLTYIPDLQWCRLGPLEIRGTFKKPSPYAGQPRWMLVRGEEAEADVSALRCANVKARAVKKTNDADNEEWVITDATQQGAAEAKAARGKAKMAVKPLPTITSATSKADAKASTSSSSSSSSSSSATSLVAAAYATAVSAVSRAARAAAASPLLASAPSAAAAAAAPPTSRARRSPSPAWSHGSSRPSSGPPTPVCADVGGGGRLKLFAPAVSPRSAPLPVKPRAGAAGTLAAASKVAASVAAAAAAAAAETSADDESTPSTSAHKGRASNGRASNGRGSSGGGAAVPVEEEPAARSNKRKASAVEVKGKKGAAPARGGKQQGRAKRQRRSGAASDDDEEEEDEEEEEEEEDEIEALLASKMPSEPGRAQTAWGKAFLKFPVRVPAGAFGAVYAKDAASLWGLKAQACKLTKFVPHSGSGASSNSRGYPRWEFEWVDPESYTVGTLDSKHLALYLRAHRDEPEEPEEPSSGSSSSKEKGTAAATSSAESQSTQRRRSGR